MYSPRICRRIGNMLFSTCVVLADIKSKEQSIVVIVTKPQPDESGGEEPEQMKAT